MNDHAIDQIRSFNRTVQERIGALSDQFLERPFPLGEARLLWEIGPDGIEIRALRGRLSLDSGYLSRVLHALAKRRFVRIRVSVNDRRVRRVYLTPAGLKERAELDRRSDQVALAILEPLSNKQRATLVAAMGEVDRLLKASMVRFAVADPATPEATWCFEQYFAELDKRFENGFDPAISISADASELTLPQGALLIAWLRDEPIGCGALKFHGDAPAELKRMWVAPVARGLGVGQRLLCEHERHAREAGVRVLRLETNRVLNEAIALYRASGYIEVSAFNDEAYAHHWFEKRLD